MTALATADLPSWMTMPLPANGNGNANLLRVPAMTAPRVPAWSARPYLPPGWDKSKLSRLHENIDSSLHNLQKFRDEWVRLIEYAVGNHYNGGRASRVSRPINPIRTALAAYVSQLAGAVPDCQVWPENPDLQPEAYKMKYDVNRTIKSLELDEFQERLIMEAFLGLSMAKVTLDASEITTVAGMQVRKLRPKVELVDTEDAILDCMAKGFKDRIEFVGNRYLRPIDEVLADPRYDEYAKQYVRRQGSSNRGDNPVPWDQRPLAIANISRNDHEEGLEDQVRLMDVYLPKKKWFLTLLVGHPTCPPLFGTKWYACDPYIPLTFEWVAGNSLPMPLARHWLDLARSVDNAYSKLLNQMRRQKTVAVITGGSAADAERLDATPDGGGYRCDNPTAMVKEARYGGPDALTSNWAIHIRQVYSDVAGGINAMMGVGMKADTATAASIEGQGASTAMNNLQRRVGKCWGKIMQAVAWFTFNDATHNPPIEYGDRRILAFYDDQAWTYEERQRFDFFSFMFDIVPASNTYQTPEQKAMSLIRLLTQVYQPFAMLGMQQGEAISVGEMIRQTAELLNLETEVRTLMMRVDIPARQPMTMDTGPFAGSGGQLVAPPAGNHRYIHESRPSTQTRQGQEAVMQQALLSSMKGTNGEGS